jgi:predicted NBD/HSP70 family sugar kinase
MDDARDAFAASCVSIVDVFNPELIVVGGSLARGQGERWLAPAREAVMRHGFLLAARRVRLVLSALGDDVGLVGGIVLVGSRGAG